MFKTCCPDLLVSISTEYPELIGYGGLYHPIKNETTGRGGKAKKIITVFRSDLKAGRKQEQTLLKNFRWLQNRERIKKLFMF